MISNDLCAVILAGGRSRRMGVNKALLKVGGQPLIQKLIDRVLPLTPRILISSNDAASYRFLKLPVVPDCFMDRGPLAGIHAVMKQNACSLYIVLACDLPNLRDQILPRFLEIAEGFDAVIPRTRDGVAHPLCAIYRRSCLPVIEHALKRGDSKVIEAFLNPSLSIRWVDPDEGLFLDSDLANINTPEDLHRLNSSSSEPMR